MIKTNRSVIAWIFLVYMGDTQENWVTPQNGSSHHIKCYLQLKTKEDVLGGGQLWEVTRKVTVNKNKVVMQIKLVAFSIDEFLEI